MGILLLGWIGAIKATGASLATVALVEASADLTMSSAQVTVAASIGTLAVAATVIATGLAADRVGRRRVLMLSFAVAGIGSVMSLVAWDSLVYVVGLVVAGIGFGAMFSGSFAYVRQLAPGAALGWALGLFGAYCSLLAAAASIGGGALSAWSWRGMFLIAPAMCVVAAIATLRLLPPMPRVNTGPVDWWGLVTLGAAMVMLLAGISQLVNTLGGLGAWFLAGGCVLTVVWVIIERRSSAPSFPVSLFASGMFTGAAIVGVAFNLVQSASTLQLSDYWQYLGQWTPMSVTMGIQPFYVIGVIGALLAGRALSAGRSARVVVVVSCVLTGLGFLVLAGIDPRASYWGFLPAIVLIGIGMMAGTTAQAQVFVREAPAASYGAVTASKTTVGQIGFALGFALSSLLADRLTLSGAISRLAAAGMPEYQARHSLTGASSHLHVGHVPDTAQGKEILAAAMASYQHAYVVIMLVCAATMAGAAALAWWLMRDSNRDKRRKGALDLGSSLPLRQSEPRQH